MPFATGFCSICNKRVPVENLNKFYCSETCRQEGWRRHHSDEAEPDWASIHAYAAVMSQIRN
jgi:hypothetical protein